MRGAVVLALLVALLAGCSHRPAAPLEAKQKAGYNRREIDTPRPGLLTGGDGSWTVLRSGDARPAEPPPARTRTRTTLLCDRGEACDPPISE